MGRDEQILGAAERLIFERGFEGVGVDAIGEAAGISGSAIYRHFESKDEILAVLFDQAIDALLVKISAPLPDPDDDIRQLVAVHVGFASERPMLAGIWLREQRSLADPYRRAFRRRQRRYNDRWRSCLDVRYPGNSPERISSAMRGVHALILSDATRPPHSSSDPDVEDLLTDMALRSLAVLDKGE